MIKTFYQEDIIKCLAVIITYGLNKGYSYRAIEEYFIHSPFVNDLENNEYNIESKLEEVVAKTYNDKLEEEADITYKGLFFAESYFRLFLHYNRSFEYLFLYWPLESFDQRYNVYHEMDFSNLRIDFDKEVKKNTLLRKLSLDREIKMTDISKLTGINEHTVVRYSRDDKYLYSASYENVYKLSTLFNVKENIFVSNLAVYMDQSIYLFDKSNKIYRDYLGFYYANYYDKRINENDFEYDKTKGHFISNSGIKLIVIADVLNNISVERVDALSDQNTFVVIIPSGFFGDETYFEYLNDSRALEVFVLTQEFVYIVKRDVKKEITDTINRSLIIRAKESIDK